MNTTKEYISSKIGWGHSCFEDAINTAKRAKVKNLIFFHHEPVQKDSEIDELAEKYGCPIKGKTAMEIEVVLKGLEIEI